MILQDLASSSSNELQWRKWLGLQGAIKDLQVQGTNAIFNFILFCALTMNITKR